MGYYRLGGRRVVDPEQQPLTAKSDKSLIAGVSPAG